MEGQDQIAKLLDHSVTSQTKIVGVFVSIGLICVLSGLGLLISQSTYTSREAPPLPSFPSQAQLKAIADSTQENSIDQVAVNTATIEELDGLAGIGLVRAQKIIEKRPFTDFDDVVQRSGIPKTVLDGLRSQLKF